MPDLYTHHEPAGVCGICNEHRDIIRSFAPLSAEDRASIFRHARTCDVLAVQVAAARAQLEAKREAGEFVGLAHSWLTPAPIPVAMAAEISLVMEDVT